MTELMVFISVLTGSLWVAIDAIGKRKTVAGKVVGLVFDGMTLVVQSATHHTKAITRALSEDNQFDEGATAFHFLIQDSFSNWNDMENKAGFTEVVMALVAKERHKQNEKWGEQNHNPIEWAAIIGEEFGEMSREAVDIHFRNPVKGRISEVDNFDRVQRVEAYQKELIQLAAVTIQAVECLMRQRANCESASDFFDSLEKGYERKN